MINARIRASSWVAMRLTALKIITGTIIQIEYQITRFPIPCQSIGWSWVVLKTVPFAAVVVTVTVVT